jgi:hypothetical protein
MKSAVENSLCNPPVVETKEDVNDNVERYPAVPKPATVDVISVMFVFPPGPIAVEKVERDPAMEEKRDRVETYPAEPKPVTVDKRVVVDKNPAVPNSL